MSTAVHMIIERAQNQSQLTHHTNDVTLQHYNGFGYVQSTAPTFMMWLLVSHANCYGGYGEWYRQFIEVLGA